MARSMQSLDSLLSNVAGSTKKKAASLRKHLDQIVLQDLTKDVNVVACDDYNIVHKIKTLEYLYQWRDRRVQHCERVEEEYLDIGRHSSLIWLMVNQSSLSETPTLITPTYFPYLQKFLATYNTVITVKSFRLHTHQPSCLSRTIQHIGFHAPPCVRHSIPVRCRTPAGRRSGLILTAGLLYPGQEDPSLLTFPTKTSRGIGRCTQSL